MRRLLATAFSVLFGAELALAHEQSLHKGRATEGEVVSVSKDGLAMQTAKGKVAVMLSETTTVERGDEKIRQDAIHAGDHVSVFGTTLATGELVARDVILDGAHGQAEHHHE